MSDPTTPATGAESSVMEDLRSVEKLTAGEARQFLEMVKGVASGAAPQTAIPLLLLGLSQILVTGARLGAIEDIVPTEQFEADPGEDADFDLLRERLSAVFDGLDDYCDVTDPVTDPDPTTGRLSDDLVDVCAELVHGLRHHEAGRTVEALWWWQFSYLSTWGQRAATALRVLQGILAHIRLDADEDVVSEAEFEALHS